MDPRVRLLYYILLDDSEIKELSPEIKALLLDQEAMSEMGRVIAQYSLDISYDCWDVTIEVVTKAIVKDLINESED